MGQYPSGIALLVGTPSPPCQTPTVYWVCYPIHVNVGLLYGTVVSVPSERGPSDPLSLFEQSVKQKLS